MNDLKPRNGAAFQIPFLRRILPQIGENPGFCERRLRGVVPIPAFFSQVMAGVFRLLLSAGFRSLRWNMLENSTAYAMMRRIREKQARPNIMAKSNISPARNGVPSKGRRLFRINSLIDAIATCEWEDALHVISAYVDDARASFPPLDPDDILSKNDVAFCSEQISFEDLRAYYIGCGIKEIRERVNKAVNDGA